MFKHEIPWNITGEEADTILDEVQQIEPDAFLEVAYIIHHKNPYAVAIIDHTIASLAAPQEE